MCSNPMRKTCICVQDGITRYSKLLDFGVEKVLSGMEVMISCDIDVLTVLACLGFVKQYIWELT